MTVCTAHEYAGPKACPYCERDQLRRQLEQEQRALEAEVARLRESRVQQLREIERLNGVLITERAAREATKAERDKYSAEIDALAHRVAIQRLETEAAEARVTELERKNEGLGRAKDKFASRAYLAEARVTELVAEVQSERELCSEALRNQGRFRDERDAAGTAIDQARGLLERAVHSGWDKNMQDESRVWLRANPATATPAATGAERQHCSEHAGWRSDCEQCAEKGQATPAATGAERCPQCRMVGSHKMDCTDPSRKEQGT